MSRKRRNSPTNAGPDDEDHARRPPPPNAQQPQGDYVADLARNGLTMLADRLESLVQANRPVVEIDIRDLREAVEAIRTLDYRIAKENGTLRR